MIKLINKTKLINMDLKQSDYLMESLMMSGGAYKTLLSGVNQSQDVLNILIDTILREQITKYLYLVCININSLSSENLEKIRQQLFKNLVKEKNIKIIYWSLINVNGFSEEEIKKLIKIFVNEIISNNKYDKENLIKYIKRAIDNLPMFINKIQLNILNTKLKILEQT